MKSVHLETITFLLCLSVLCLFRQWRRDWLKPVEPQRSWTPHSDWSENERLFSIAPATLVKLKHSIGYVFRRLQEVACSWMFHCMKLCSCHPSINKSAHSYICLLIIVYWFISSSVCLSIRPSIRPPFHLFCASVRPPVHSPIYWSIHPFSLNWIWFV